MIAPTEADIGRTVLFVGNYRRARGAEGTIMSFNRFYVFVQWNEGFSPEATERRDLYWPDGEKK